MASGVIFDLDGTLLDTLADLTDAVNYTLRRFDCPERTLDEVRSFVGTGARNLIALSLPGRSDDPDLDLVLAVYQDYYRAHAQEKTGPYPGINEALAHIRQRWPIAIVSNKPDAAVKPLCRDYFGGDIYALGEHEGCPRKPAPDMVHKAMAAIGVDTCVYVGDSETDIVTARNVGVPCLSVTWGFRDQSCLTQAGAAHLCTSPDELPALLARLLP